VIKSTLSKWLHDAATNTGQPHLVLAMISVLLAATIVFIYAEFLAGSRQRRLAYSAPHVDSPLAAFELWRAKCFVTKLDRHRPD
jgi:hypothetical protein